MKKKPTFDWEKYGLFSSLALLFIFGGVFTARRMESKKQVVEEPPQIVEKKESEAPAPDSGETIDATGRRIATTACGEKDLPTPFLRYPNVMLKSHVAGYEKESSSFLERSKLKNGISMVFIQELCPERTIHFSLHFPEKGLIAKPPAEAGAEYSRWIKDLLSQVEKAGVTREANHIFEKVRARLDAAETDPFLILSQPEWGGVQITFKLPMDQTTALGIQ